MTETRSPQEKSSSRPDSFWDADPDTISDVVRRESVLATLGGENLLRSFMLASPEQIRQAQKVGQAILESPLAKNPSNPLTRDDLELVVAGSFIDHKDGSFSVIIPDGEPRVAYLVCTKGFDLTKDPSFVDPVTHTSKKFNETNQLEIMSKENDSIFNVTVEGRSYDTRLGMDMDGYASMVMDRISRGQKPPEVGNKSVTFLTGMPIDHVIHFASAYSRSYTDPGLKPSGGRESTLYQWRGYKGYNFRPAIKLEPHLV